MPVNIIPLSLSKSKYNIEYGAVPVVGVGHSCGSLLHMLITSLFPDTPRAANALISYNNRGVSEAIPFFEELIVPLFSNKDINGSELMKAMISVAREKYNGKLLGLVSLSYVRTRTVKGNKEEEEELNDIVLLIVILLIKHVHIIHLFYKQQLIPQSYLSLHPTICTHIYIGKVPSDDALQQLIQTLPKPPGFNLETVLTPSLISIPKPVRETLTNIITEPTYNTLSTSGIPSLLLQSLDITQQIPKLIDEVEEGARDFVPTPDAMSSAARRAYRCRRTLLLQFDNDNLDDSEILEGYLKEAESVMKMKRPMITINLERKVLEGNHLTPLLGPSGGEGWGEALEDTLGGILGGGAVDNGSDEEENASGDDEGSSSNAKAVRERLGYEQVERVVDELVAWLDEGSL